MKPFSGTVVGTKRATGVKEVAARAGVSVGTVSNVLNRPDVVAEPTRRRVIIAIAQLGFLRNESGRLLRAGKSRTIAYVMLEASNPFFFVVATGIDLDHRGELFAPVRALFELGPQTVLHRRAVCDQCRQFNAVYTQVLAGGEPFTERLAPSTPLPDDGTFTYEARCRTCFVRPA